MEDYNCSTTLGDAYTPDTNNIAQSDVLIGLGL